ncbi:MAG: tRNA guanosine(15) transglycosylase TgtA [Candidatus Hodarchaeales archaeon]
MTFSIRKKDGLARIGNIITPHGKIETPVLLPVISPNRQVIPPEEMVKCGAEAFITNAYILYKDETNREKVLNMGLHKFIGFDGPIMTDSGAFQLMEYGEVDISNKEVTKFQEDIGTDIGVFLDCPTRGGTYEDFSTALKETLKRADEHIDARNPEVSMLWAGPIQGGKYLDLVKESCNAMRKKDFTVHPIGSVVPLLEQYDYESVVKMILTVKQNLPFNKPIHLFGAGHPMFFAIAVFLGIDIFDSAAYILYAQKNRYITVFGTNYLENLQYFPCTCEVCQTHTVKELKQLDRETRTILLAKHNLNVSLEEIRIIKQAIVEGRMYELVMTRILSHPSMAKLIETLFSNETSTFIEKFDPISKSRALLISHPALVKQPALVHYRNRILDRFYQWNKRLLICQDFQNIHSAETYQVIKLSPLFGVVPDELRGVYPLVQHERIPLEFSAEQIGFIKKFIEKYKSRFDEIVVHPSVNLEYEFLTKYPVFEEKRGKRADTKHILFAMFDYQFGSGVHTVIDTPTLKIERSRKTGIIRRISDERGSLGTIRPSDFTIVPSPLLASILHKYIKSPSQRVTASEESIPYVLKNKDLLAKFVLKADPRIRPGEEALVVDSEDNLLNFGKSVLSAQEMIEFDHGVAIQVRR